MILQGQGPEYTFKSYASILQRGIIYLQMLLHIIYFSQAVF